MSYPVKDDNKISPTNILLGVLLVCVAIAYNSLRTELFSLQERIILLEEEPSVESSSMRLFLIDTIEGLESDMENMRARMQTIESRRR